MSGFYQEDYALAEELAQTVDMLPSTAKRVAGKWAAVKIRRKMEAAAARGDWNQYYFLADMARDIERGDL